MRLKIDGLEQLAAAAIGKTFRGEVWEFAADIPMGKGFKNDGKPFNIEEAKYLKPVFRQIKNPKRRKHVWKAGVQGLKSYAAVKSAAYKIVHDPGDMAIYDCDIEAARDNFKSRLGPMLKSIPEIDAMIASVESRHDVGISEMYLPGMTLRMWPLNISSTQRITLRYVVISDGFLSGNTGLVEQAIARTTQHPHDKMIIIESQGSDENDDFDRQYQSTDQGELHVVCPVCGMNQPFEFDRKRDDGSYSGFQRGPDEKILLKSGKYDEAAIMRETFYECFFCRKPWLDNYKIRAHLDESSNYIPANPNANPENAGFNWPNWINTRIPWGGDAVMLGYLIAKRADKEFANKEPLKQWYQKRAAKTWSDRLSGDKIPVIIGDYDPHKEIANQDHKGMIIDCQKHETLDTVGTFWFEVYAADKSGNSFQLDRGFVKSWEALDAMQAKWKIENQFVCIDGRKWTPEIFQQVAIRRKIVKAKKFGREIQYPSCWLVFMGDAPTRNSYPWPDKQWRAWSPPTFNRVSILNEKGGREIVTVQSYRWANLAIKDQLHSLRIGGEGKPKFQALPHAQTSPETQAKETGDLAYDMQMDAELRGEKNGKPFWDKVRPDNHYLDLACMRIVRMGMRSLASHVAAPE